MRSEATAPREERRVITIVFTDLVGLTKRSEELDPEDVRSLLGTYCAQARPIFEAQAAVG
jgi:class 3 adenylate cyclase